ncbi:hypothetical protein E4U59_002640 [Claviceps monticola]|nr:hypothetical protein E4U59_002640 [Claviceps monticola]
MEDLSEWNYYLCRDLGTEIVRDGPNRTIRLNQDSERLQGYTRKMVPYLKISLIIVYSVSFNIAESCQRRMMHVAVIMKRRHAATRNQLGPESAPLVYR